MSEPRLSESGYKRKHRKICDNCRSPDLDYSIKGYVKCGQCKKLYGRTHIFKVEVE